RLAMSKQHTSCLRQPRGGSEVPPCANQAATNPVQQTSCGFGASLIRPPAKDNPVPVRAHSPHSITPCQVAEQHLGVPVKSPSSLSFPPALAPAVTVVDDEPMAQDVLVRAARSWHFDCQAAATAEQALELLEQNLTPIVVTDLRMPGL